MSEYRDSFSERMSAIKNVAKAIKPDAIEMTCGIYCNGCGKFIQAASVDELRFISIGWRIGKALGDDDFCPECK